jgi:hypothetical protein
MTEQARGRGLDKAERGEMGDETVMRELTGLLQAIDGFVGPEETAGAPSSPIGFGERGETKARKNLGGIVIKEDFKEGRVGVGRTEVIVSQIDRPKIGVFRHDSIENAIEGRVGSGGSRDRYRHRESVPTRCSPHPAIDVGRNVP